MNSTGIIYQYNVNPAKPLAGVSSPLPPPNKPFFKPPAPSGTYSRKRTLGLALLTFAMGGLVGPLIPLFRLEGTYYAQRLYNHVNIAINPPLPLPPSTPKVFNPLVTSQGPAIDPVNQEFSLIIPKIGVNAPVIPAVNPANPAQYLEALKHGVAHASTSYFPNQTGMVYLFSHSTNYDWFAKDLNAVFYHLKNLEAGDTIIVFYKGKEYIYRLREKRIVSPNEVAYLVGQPGKRTLILQTCWPPGSTLERLLIFADLIEEQTQAI